MVHWVALVFDLNYHRFRLFMSAIYSIGLSRNISFLYFHRLLIQIGVALLGIFLPIYLYEQFGLSLAKVILIFVVTSAGYSLLLPWGGMLMSRIGVKRSLILAIPLWLLALASLILLAYSPLFVIPYVAFDVLGRLFYWVPYHIDFAKFTNRRTRGRQIALLQSISYLVLAVSPALAGLVLIYTGFNSLLLIVIGMYVLSIFPIIFIQPTHETYSYGYRESFGQLFAKRNRSLLLGYAGDGMQEIIGLVIWPIFIYGIFQARYAAIGIVTSLSIVVVVVLSLVVGYLSDRWSKQRMLRIGSILYTSGWLLKVFVVTGWQVFLVDSYHQLGSAVSRTSFDATAYEQAADNGHYVDEYTVLKEMALNGARVPVLLLALIVVAFFGINVVFVLAALATLMTSLLSWRAAKMSRSS